MSMPKAAHVYTNIYIVMGPKKHVSIQPSHSRCYKHVGLGCIFKSVQPASKKDELCCLTQVLCVHKREMSNSAENMLTT